MAWANYWLDGSVDEVGNAQVNGALRYTGSDPFTGIAVVRVHALDACGSVVSRGFEPIRPRPLAPGSVVTFSTLLLNAEGAVRLRAVAEARIAPALVADDALRVYGVASPRPRRCRSWPSRAVAATRAPTSGQMARRCARSTGARRAVGTRQL